MKLWSRFRERLQEEGQRVRAKMDPDGNTTRALAAFARPNMGPTPEPLRRYLEPLVAAVAAMVMGGLLCVGMTGFAMLFVAAGLIYTILMFVFGIEFDFNLPL